ncbi:MAG: hypothetical protein K1X66_04990 [Verrucomicrobiae bacterium]|nr:hypothetical protein [Verrucomicrobiae bacterium]
MASLSQLTQQKQNLITHIAQQRTSLTQQARNLRPAWRFAKLGFAAAGFAKSIAAFLAIRSLLKKQKQEKPPTIESSHKSGVAKFFSGLLLASKVVLPLLRRRK